MSKKDIAKFDISERANEDDDTWSDDEPMGTPLLEVSEPEPSSDEEDAFTPSSEVCCLLDSPRASCCRRLVVVGGIACKVLLALVH